MTSVGEERAHNPFFATGGVKIGLKIAYELGLLKPLRGVPVQLSARPSRTRRHPRWASGTRSQHAIFAMTRPGGLAAPLSRIGATEGSSAIMAARAHRGNRRWPVSRRGLLGGIRPWRDGRRGVSGVEMVGRWRQDAGENAAGCIFIEERSNGWIPGDHGGACGHGGIVHFLGCGLDRRVVFCLGIGGLEGCSVLGVEHRGAATTAGRGWG